MSEANQQLQLNHIAALNHSTHTAETAQSEKRQLQNQLKLLHDQHRATQLEHKQLMAASQEKFRLLQAQYDLLQIKHAETLQQNHQIANDDIKEILAKYNNIQTYLERRADLAVIAEKQLRSSSTRIQTSVSELRQTISAHFKGLQEVVTSSSKQLHTLTIDSQPDPQRVMELAKIEAFGLWVQRQPDTEQKVSAETFLYRVTAKFNHTFKNFRSHLHQVTTKRDDLQTILSNKRNKKLTLMHGKTF